MKEQRHPDDNGQLERWKKSQRLTAMQQKLDRLNGKKYAGDEDELYAMRQKYRNGMPLRPSAESSADTK